MLLMSMKCIQVHDCLECEKTFENKQQVKVHLLVMHCDLDLVHDHKQSCGKPFNCECFEYGKGFDSKHAVMDQRIKILHTRDNESLDRCG